MLIGSFGIFAQEPQEEVEEESKPYTEEEIEYNWCLAYSSWHLVNKTTKCINISVTINQDPNTHLKYVAKPCFRALAKSLEILKKECEEKEQLEEKL